MRNSGHFSKLKDVDISYILYVRDIGAVILLSQQRASGLTEARTKKKRKQFGARMRSFRVDSSRVLNFLSYNNLWNELLKNSFDSTSWLRLILPPQ